MSMSYRLTPISLSLATDVTHRCWLHRSRDEHLIGVIELTKPDSELTWNDIEYCRRRIEELSVMPFPDCINALVIDLQSFSPQVDQEFMMLAWRLQEEECPIRLVVNSDQFDDYLGVFDPIIVATDVHEAVKEIRQSLDMLVH